MSETLTYAQWLRSFAEIMQEQLTAFETEQREEYSGPLEHGQAPYEASESGIYEDGSCFLCLILDQLNCMPERLVKDAMLDRHGIPYQFESRLRSTILELEKVHDKTFRSMLDEFDDLHGEGTNERRIHWLLKLAQEVEDEGTDEVLDPNYTEYEAEDYDPEDYEDKDECLCILCRPDLDPEWYADEDEDEDDA